MSFLGNRCVQGCKTDQVGYRFGRDVGSTLVWHLSHIVGLLQLVDIVVAVHRVVIVLVHVRLLTYLLLEILVTDSWRYMCLIGSNC